MLRGFYLSIGCLVAATLLYSESLSRTGRGPARLVAELEAPDVSLPDLPDFSLPELGPPVLVFFVRSPESVARVRDVVADERIVAELPIGFAVREGRIVTTGADAAGHVLTAAGWSDRPLEIFEPAPQLPQWQSRKRDGPDLGALASKSHLTQAEAMAVMNALD